MKMNYNGQNYIILKVMKHCVKQKTQFGVKKTNLIEIYHLYSTIL